MPKRHYLLHVGSWFIHAGIVAGLIGVFIFIISHNIDFQNSLKGALLMDVKSQNNAVLILDTTIKSDAKSRVPVYMKSKVPLDYFKFTLDMSEFIKNGFKLDEKMVLFNESWKKESVVLKDDNLLVSATSLLPVEFIDAEEIFSLNIISPNKSKFANIKFLCGDEKCEVKNQNKKIDVFDDTELYLDGYVFVDNIKPILSKIDIKNGQLDKQKKISFEVSDEVGMDMSFLNVKIFDDINPTLVFPECNFIENSEENVYKCEFEYVFYEPYYFNIGFSDRAGNKNESYFGVDIKTNKLWEFIKK